MKHTLFAGVAEKCTCLHGYSEDYCGLYEAKIRVEGGECAGESSTPAGAIAEVVRRFHGEK